MLRCRQPHWLVVDSLQGGSGESFDWGELRLQAAGFAAHSSHGWLLAGGLTPDSVAGEQAADNRRCPSKVCHLPLAAETTASQVQREQAGMAGDQLPLPAAPV